MYTCDICGRTDSSPNTLVTRLRLPMKDATQPQGLVLYQIDICEKCSDDVATFVKQKMAQEFAKRQPQAASTSSVSVVATNPPETPQVIGEQKIG